MVLKFEAFHSLHFYLVSLLFFHSRLFEFIPASPHIKKFEDNSDIFFHSYNQYI